VESGHLRICEHQHVHALVIAVLLELTLEGFAHLQGLGRGQILEKLPVSGLGQGVPADFRESVQILRRIVRPQIGPVAPEGAMLHQPVFEEDLLAPLDVLAREDDLPCGIHHPGGNGRRPLVGLHRHQGEQGEAEDHHEDDGLPPPGGKRRVVTRVVAHGSSTVNKGLIGARIMRAIMHPWIV